jgi:hypothetical protein
MTNRTHAFLAEGTDVGAALEDVVARWHCARGHVAKSPDLVHELAARLDVRAELFERWAFLLLTCHGLWMRAEEGGVTRRILV